MTQIRPHFIELIDRCKFQLFKFWENIGKGSCHEVGYPEIPEVWDESQVLGSTFLKSIQNDCI